MVTVSIQAKEKIQNKELTKVYGQIVAYSGEKVYAKDLELKSIRVLNVTPGSLWYIAGAQVASVGELDNYAHIRLAAGSPLYTEIGSATRRTLNFVAIGE